MAIFVYADESGVFDQANNQLFVFGGLIFLSKEHRDNEKRKYINAERTLRTRSKATIKGELKACSLVPKDKSSLFRSLNNVYRFAAVVHQRELKAEIFNHKKTKQRYLDYAFKIALKRALQDLIKSGHLNSDFDDDLVVFFDEHTTATDGRYELHEGLESEFKLGTFNGTYGKFFPPLFPNLKSVNLTMKDSQKDPLIRAADIVANKVFYHARKRRLVEVSGRVFLTHLP